MPSAKDLRGLRFGDWLVLEQVSSSPSGRARWICRCACGNERVLTSKVLLASRSRSCGCLRKRVNRQLKLKDLSLQKIGCWTVLKRIASRRQRTYWLCRCTCGVLREVSAGNLHRGLTTSCGCRGELDLHRRRRKQRRRDRTTYLR